MSLYGFSYLTLFLTFSSINTLLKNLPDIYSLTIVDDTLAECPSCCQVCYIIAVVGQFII